MAVQTGLSAGLIGMQGSGGDTTLHNQATRSVITGHSIKNNASVQVQVTIYRSPDSSSASGDPIASYTIPVGGSQDILETIGMGLQADEFIVGVVNTVGIGLHELVSSVTYTLFTGSS